MVRSIMLKHFMFMAGFVGALKLELGKPHIRDHRKNVIKATVAETVWSVGVLTNSNQENCALEAALGECVTNMDLLWWWIKKMMNNKRDGLPFRVEESDSFLEKVKDRNTHPTTLLAALFEGHGFKNGFDASNNCVYGMDCYINSRLQADSIPKGKGPDGSKARMNQRSAALRGKQFFQERGREDLEDEYIRQNSLKNRHAGIAALEFMPPEAMGFWPVKITHGGKSYYTRDDHQYGAKLLRHLRAPYAGGASGSIEYMVLSMEDTGCKHCKEGLIPLVSGDNPSVIREALLGLMTAILIAAGQHSLAECLLVAQAMGYFTGVEDVSQNYYAAAESFETYMASLGVEPLFADTPLETLNTIPTYSEDKQVKLAWAVCENGYVLQGSKCVEEQSGDEGSGF